MFCPKCGSEVKEGAGFCPKCGHQIQKKPAPAAPAAGKVKTAATPPAGGKGFPSPQRQGGSGAALAMDFLKAVPKKALAVAAGAVALVCLLFFLLSPKAGDIDTQGLVEEYFAERTDYQAAQEQYESCFRYVASDLAGQMEGKLSSLMKGVGMDVGSGEAREAAEGIQDMVVGYFSNPENQTKLGDAITSYSKCEAGKAKKKDGVVRAQVTVESLDISQVNSLVVSDSTNALGIARLAMGFIGGGLSGQLMDMASGDASFILDAFIKKAAAADGRNTCTGEVEFEYDKEEKEWVVSSVDESLLDAYFGIR